MKLKAGLILWLVTGFLAVGPHAGLAAHGDIVFERPAGGIAGFSPAVFPHWVHRIRFRCDVCHSEIFEMKKGANKVTMEKINQGEFCGQCHNGKTAFNVEFQSCTRCHRSPVKTKP